MASLQTIAILGRQPALGLAELERLFGAGSVRPFGAHAALLVGKLKPEVINRLGGSIKLGRILTPLSTPEWRSIEDYLKTTVVEHADMLPDGKLTFGVSAYGFSVSPQKINAMALQFKKLVRASGRSVRIVTNKETTLSSAQVLHNGLTSKNSWELLVVTDGKEAILAQTIAVQDIEAYAARDQRRPFRDAKVGMLPPKLAQLLINLAHPPAGSTVLDPFCGTGVVLQEAMLMGYNAYGIDIDARMVEYSRKNIAWLYSKLPSLQTSATIELADATQYSWHNQNLQFEAVACETYLGKPLSTLPERPLLEKIITECNGLHERFLANMAHQAKSGLPLCLAVPAWRGKNGFHHLPVLDHLKELGYNRLSFTHVRNEELLYYRPGQIVARELVVVEKS